jgi:hypothetical protein
MHQQNQEDLYRSAQMKAPQPIEPTELHRALDIKACKLQNHMQDKGIYQGYLVFPMLVGWSWIDARIMG